MVAGHRGISAKEYSIINAGSRLGEGRVRLSQKSVNK